MTYFAFRKSSMADALASRLVTWNMINQPRPLAPLEPDKSKLSPSQAPSTDGAVITTEGGVGFSGGRRLVFVEGTVAHVKQTERLMAAGQEARSEFPLSI